MYLALVSIKISKEDKNQEKQVNLRNPFFNKKLNNLYIQKCKSKMIFLQKQKQKQKQEEGRKTVIVFAHLQVKS